MNCKNCGNEIKKESKFCGKCGNTTIVSKVKDEGKTPIKNAIVGVISLCVFIASWVGARYLTQEGISSVTTKSKQEIIKESVNLVKQQVTLPQKIDDVTTWVDVKETPEAIHYEYVLHDIDENQISETLIRNMIVPSTCADLDTRAILDKDIKLEYIYNVSGSLKTYFISVSKYDCL